MLLADAGSSAADADAGEADSAGSDEDTDEYDPFCTYPTPEDPQMRLGKPRSSSELRRLLEPAAAVAAAAAGLAAHGDIDWDQ
eukprot:16410685-Heterocapsa_arctica.AAC.1